ncbi:MAG: DUF1592 domain-containing protein [Gammaproteobacteria bacterium]|nr:DUF1592 domain-containing protein [Gammaproteobacteria bacterium]
MTCTSGMRPSAGLAFRAGLASAVVGMVADLAFATPPPNETGQMAAAAAFVRTYCASCHTERTRHVRCQRCHTEHGDSTFADLDLSDIASHTAAWEKVVVKLRGGLMPPLDAHRPDQAVADRFRRWLSSELDRVVDEQPDPGPSPVFRRLNRGEYQNAVGDLLHVDIDAAHFLPADDSSHGFDNMAGTLRVSPLLMERYLAAAKAVSRLVVGSKEAFDSRTYHIGTEAERRVRFGGPVPGAEGGTQLRHYFPRDGDYEFTVSLEPVNRPGARRTTPELVDRLLELAVDGNQIGTFTVAKPDREIREPPKFRVSAQVTAGEHDVAARFYKAPLNLVDGLLEPLVNERGEGETAGATGSVPRLNTLTVEGPFNAGGPGDTPSRRALFVCSPRSAAEEASCAETILTALARQAFRGMATAVESQSLVRAYDEARRRGDSFDDGIGYAVRRLLVSPHFLFRVEADTESGGSPVRPVSAVELASRLSFFLWSSIPDEPLLSAAEHGLLDSAAQIEAQVRRMLADPRAWALTSNFASQWLELRSLAFYRPTAPLSFHYDEALRDAFQAETERFFDHVLRHDRPVTELLTARYTFLNKRLAEHYGIAGVQHPDLRRVELAAESPRGGLLGHGSLLAITSHADRTSPVLRGKWVLANLLGTPPPPPPPDVPDLEGGTPGVKAPTLREQLKRHRDHPACANCHNLIDPAGFALENFDAIGRWRERDDSWNPIDSAAILPDGTMVDGVEELKHALVRKPERFATTIAERLLTYALGRGLEPYDAPAVRKIVSEAAEDGYRIQSLIIGVAKSYPFVMRRTIASREHKTPEMALHAHGHSSGAD